MTGTFINVTAIIVSCLLGIFFGARLLDNLKNTVVAGMGLFTTAIGFQMSLKTENPLIVLGALIVGGLLGEWSQIENRIQYNERCSHSHLDSPPSARPVR
jgi:uncharacterized membrane protein YqgA involved in biofilm formation